MGAMYSIVNAIRNADGTVTPEGTVPETTVIDGKTVPVHIKTIYNDDLGCDPEADIKQFAILNGTGVYTAVDVSAFQNTGINAQDKRRAAREASETVETTGGE